MKHVYKSQFENHFHGTAVSARLAVATIACAWSWAAADPPAQEVAVGVAPTESARREALSPFRFILRHADTAKPASGASAPGRTKTVRTGSQRGHTAGGATPLNGNEQASSAAVNSDLGSPEPQSLGAQTEKPIAKAQTAGPVLPSTASESLPTRAAPEAALPRPLIAVKQGAPLLPSTLAQHATAGLVKVSFDVQPDGTTSNVKVTRSTNPRLNTSVVSAVSAWTFRPIEERRSAEVEVVLSDQ